MAFPKIKFCWNGSRVEADWHLGLFGIYARGLAGGRLRGIVISGRGVLAWLCGLTVVAYFTGAAALWFWLERRPYNYVTYADIILPTRWSGIQKLRGQALVAEGLDDIKARNWGPGLSKLRIGIARNPDEIDARLTLAEMFIAMKARKQAIDVYEGGLASKYPGREYIETMLKAAMQSEDIEWALRTCDRALALIEDEPAHPDYAWLVEKRLGVLIAADRSGEALASVALATEPNSPALLELRVLALLKSGEGARAVELLENWAGAGGGRSNQQVLRLKVRAYRETGDFAAMDRALEQMRASAPMDLRVYVFGVVQQSLAERRAEAQVWYERFLLRFGSVPRNLLILAEPLAEISDRVLLERLMAYAQQQGFDLEPHRRLLVQSLTGSGEWREAARVLDQAGAAAKQSEAAPWYDLMHAQVQAALDPADGAQSNLVSAVRGRQFTLNLYKDLVRNMRQAGRPATARELVTFAQGVYPNNPLIDTWRKELDAELAAAQAARAAALPPRPSARVPETTGAAVAASGSAPGGRVVLDEADFDARLDALTKAGDYAGALQAIRDVRLAKPAWLGTRDAALYREEIRFSGRTGDLLTLRSAARFYINGDARRSADVIHTARELHRADRKDEAVFLLRELLAKVPDYALAQRLIAEWTAKPTPAAATP